MNAYCDRCGKRVPIGMHRGRGFNGISFAVCECGKRIKVKTDKQLNQHARTVTISKEDEEKLLNFARNTKAVRIEEAREIVRRILARHD